MSSDNDNSIDLINRVNILEKTVDRLLKTQQTNWITLDQTLTNIEERIEILSRACNNIIDNLHLKRETIIPLEQRGRFTIYKSDS